MAHLNYKTLPTDYIQTSDLYNENITIKFVFKPNYKTQITMTKLLNIYNKLNLSIERINNDFMDVHGAADKIGKLLDIEFYIFKNSADEIFYAPIKDVKIPKYFNFVQDIFGLDNFPKLKPYFILGNTLGDVLVPESLSEPNTLEQRAPRFLSYFTPLQLANLYNFPNNTGAGQTIGIIELGGGYSSSDMNTYFNNLGLSVKPTIINVNINGAYNNPADTSGANYEVVLDIQVAGAIANAAKIVVYFAPNSYNGFYNAFYTAINDTVNNPNVLSISWGAPELYWGSSNLNRYNSLFAQAVAKKITIYCAAGDNGSSDGVGPYNAKNADFPASSPNVVACGGTTLNSNGTTISSEVVWNVNPSNSATGGGFSSFFSKPSYQNGITKITTRRGLPDIAANANPQTGYLIYINGGYSIIGGTSAVSPLMAGLHARINVAKGTAINFINTKVYQSSDLCVDITVGNNGGYMASSGWDPCSGKGRINGSKAVLRL